MYKFFLVLILLVIGGGAAGWYFYSDRQGEGLSIVAQKPEIVTIGVPFELAVHAGNDGRTVLNDVNVILELPEGIAFIGDSVQKTTNTKNIGDIGVGGTAKTDFKLIVLNGENTIKKITITVSYVPKGVNSRFEKTAAEDIAVGNAAMILDLVAPEHVVAGQEFTLEVQYKNATPIDMNGMRLKLQYPPGFEFKRADLPPDIGGNTWNVGGLRIGSAMNLKIKGNLIGAVASAFEFKAILEATFEGEYYQVAEKTVETAMIESPLLIAVNLDGESDVAEVDQELHYRLAYQNTTDIGFRDVVITAELKGDMFDFGTVKTNGVIGPLGAAIVWNRVTNPELAVVPPKSEGIVDFTIKTKKSYTIRRLSDRNFLLKVDARILSPTKIKDAPGSETVGIGRLETKLGGALTIDARAFFRDASAGVVNRGPMPPKIGTPTNYTVHWILGNTATDATSVFVSAVLPGNVRFVDAIKMDGGGVVSYAENTQTVTWRIDKIPAGVGTIRKAFEAVFQIEATPSPNFARSAMPIMGETSVRGKDEFTGLELEARDGELTTALPDDPTIGSSGGLVLP